MPYMHVQAFIERENRRLESEPRKFSDREIVVRVEYKYCPNLTIIDTPGLISAAPSPAHNALQVILSCAGIALVSGVISLSTRYWRK